jgi:hypothetical protein
MEFHVRDSHDGVVEGLYARHVHNRPINIQSGLPTETLAVTFVHDSMVVFDYTFSLCTAIADHASMMRSLGDPNPAEITQA